MLWAAAACVLLFAAALALTEWPREANRPLSPRLLLGLAVVLALALAAYAATGDVPGGDGHSHVGRVWLYRAAALEGTFFPYWSTRWYAGFPLGVYYGPLFFAVTGWIAAVAPTSVFTTVKVVLWMLHVGSGLTAAWWIAAVVGSRGAVVAGALCYALSFHHLSVILAAGALPLSVMFIALPVVLGALHRWRHGGWPAARTTAVVAASLTAIMLSHVQYGVLAAVAVTAVIGGHLLIPPAPGAARAVRQHVSLIAAIGALTTVLTAWLWLPMLVESGPLMLARSEEISRLLRSGSENMPPWRRHITGLLWGPTGNGFTIFYLGLVPLGLAAVGLGRVWRRSTAAMAYVPIAVLGFGYAILVPRFTNLWIAFLALLAAIGFETLTNGATGRRARLLFAVLALDLGTGIMPRPFELAPDVVTTATVARRAGHDRGRALVLADGRDALWRSLDVVGTDVSSLFGGIPQEATTTYPYLASSVAAAAEDLRRHGQLGSSTTALLRMLNVDAVVGDGRRPLAVSGASPAVFAAGLYPQPLHSPALDRETWSSLRTTFVERTLDTAFVRTVAELTHLDPVEPIAERLVVAEPLAAGPAPPPSGATFRVDAFAESTTAVRLTCQSSADGFVQLAYARFPWNVVRVDGRAVATYRSALGLIVVPVTAGRHDIVVVAGLSPLRTSLLWLSLAAAVVLVLVAWAGWRRIPAPPDVAQSAATAVHTPPAR